MEEEIKKITQKNINIIVNERGQVINKSIYEFGLKQKKRVFVYLLREDREYYIIQLLSLMTGIDENILNNYINTRNVFEVNTKVTLEGEDRNKYLEAMDEIINSDIYFSKHKETITKYDDYIDYILLDKEPDDKVERSDIFIIDDFYELIGESKYSGREIIERFNEYAEKYNVKFILCSRFKDIVDISNIESIQEVEM